MSFRLETWTDQLAMGHQRRVVAGAISAQASRGHIRRKGAPLKKAIRLVDGARMRALRKLAVAQIQASSAEATLADLNSQVRQASGRLTTSDQSCHVREANEQLVISAPVAHNAANLAERSRRADAISFERRARREQRAKAALAAQNIDLEARVSERTRELEEARDDALAAVHAKDEFLSNMSHELRTPMNGMLGALELLSKSELKPGQAHYLEVATASGEALLAILNEVLDFAKIGANWLRVARSPIDVNAIARSVAALFSAMAERKDIDLQFIPDDELSDMRLGDALHLRQILLNLVGNAMKFTSQGSVTLRTRLVRGWDAERVAFEVKDAGIGIDASQLERIFEPFVQADDPTHERPGGTGLGLSISRQLVWAMGGELTVSSVHGRGSTFGFELALEVAPVTAGMPQDEPVDASSTERLTGRVLLVEDNLVNQMVGRAMLESLGLEVFASENGEEALLKMATMSFSAVLMDCHMPVMDGYEATRRIRETEGRYGRHRVPIVALTANAFHSDIDRCLDTGMDAHLAKPYSTKQLRAALAPWLQGAPARPGS
jgi:signal transduction histidine kinase/ActR/RegA family two-component response regulator